MERFWAWFISLSGRAKAITVVVALMLAIVASPLFAALALATMMIGFIVFVAQLATGNAWLRWAVVFAASFIVVLVCTPLSFALYSGQKEPVAEQENTSEQNTEDTELEPTVGERVKPKPERAERESENIANENTAPEEAQVEPQPAPAPPAPPPTPEQRLRSKITATFIEPRREIMDIAISGDANGCRFATVNYKADGSDLIEYQMEEVYRASYGNNNLRPLLCNIEVNAYGTLTDDYGQNTQVLLYSTNIDRATAQRINWSNDALMVEFPNVWTVNQIHPAMEAALAQQEAERVIDCAEDEGLFDLDIDCP